MTVFAISRTQLCGSCNLPREYNPRVIFGNYARANEKSILYARLEYEFTLFDPYGYGQDGYVIIYLGATKKNFATFSHFRSLVQPCFMWACLVFGKKVIFHIFQNTNLGKQRQPETSKTWSMAWMNVSEETTKNFVTFCHFRSLMQGIFIHSCLVFGKKVIFHISQNTN